MKEYHKIQTVFHRNPKTNHKTLLEGVYSCPEFEFLKDNIWTFTEKVDGTNIRVFYEGSREGEIKFGGRTANAQLPATLVEVLTNIFQSKKDVFREKFGDSDVCFYGEGYGPKIQKVGALYREDQSFVLFDVKIGVWWLERGSVEEIATDFGIDAVPIVGRGTLDEMIDLVRAGFDSRWGDFPAEGVIAKPEVELLTRGGRRIITKLKHIDFR